MKIGKTKNRIMQRCYYLFFIFVFIACNSSLDRDQFSNVVSNTDIIEDSLTQKIYFDSANPFSFKDIITNLDNQPPQKIFGVLKMPTRFNEKNKYPVIIAVAGSNGWSDHHYEYLAMYRQNGIATFELCSFQSRGISSTVGTQVEVTTRAEAGFSAEVWPCLVQAISSDGYYLSIDELLLICRLAGRNVAIFEEREQGWMYRACTLDGDGTPLQLVSLSPRFGLRHSLDVRPSCLR